MRENYNAPILGGKKHLRHFIFICYSQKSNISTFIKGDIR